MIYPHDFPEHLRPPVDRVIATADAEYFDELRCAGLQHGTYGGQSERTIERLIHEYCAKIFFAFCRQARQAGKDGLWGSERIRLEIESYLQRLIALANQDKHPTHSIYGERQTGEIAKMKAHKEWTKHQRAIGKIAKLQDRQQRLKTPKDTKVDREAIRAAYFSRFPNAVILDVCWAARQHYREWRKWIKGEAKTGSKPDRAFRAVMTSNKSPEEHRHEDRPKEWK